MTLVSFENAVGIRWNDDEVIKTSIGFSFSFIRANFSYEVGILNGNVWVQFDCISFDGGRNSTEFCQIAPELI